ncbi:MAG: hypothetical protein ACI9KN_001451 [Gammaproteobacteria bacterium]|jgi:hypothetical protein
MVQFFATNSPHRGTDPARPSCATPDCGSTCHFAYSCRQQYGGGKQRSYWPLGALVIFMGFSWLAGFLI